MDCCSLEGRTLKQEEVVKVLAEFVLVRLEPMVWDEDREFGEKFGLSKFPALLLLDPTGTKKLATLGDVSPAEVARVLRSALRP